MEVKTPPDAVIPEVELMAERAQWPVFSRAWFPGAQVVEVLDWH
jgi:hypothetical protein